MRYISVWLGLIILTAAIAVACATPEPINRRDRSHRRSNQNSSSDGRSSGHRGGPANSRGAGYSARTPDGRNLCNAHCNANRAARHSNTKAYRDANGDAYADTTPIRMEILRVRGRRDHRDQ